MDAANVRKLTLKRVDGPHFIPSIKLNKFSVSSNSFASLSSFVIKQKLRERLFVTFRAWAIKLEKPKIFSSFRKDLTSNVSEKSSSSKS